MYRVAWRDKNEKTYYSNAYFDYIDALSHFEKMTGLDLVTSKWVEEAIWTSDTTGRATPTVEEWAEQMDAERVRQVEHGYDDAHDAAKGPSHLLNWAIDYGRRGNNVASATLTRCAMGLLSYSASVSEAEVKVAYAAALEAAREARS